MTLNELRAMFLPGQRWKGVRVDLGPKNGVREDVREVVEVTSREFVFRLEDGTLYYTPMPKAKGIIEARDGYVRFNISRFEVTLERLNDD